jgi:hypothetical protein
VAVNAKAMTEIMLNFLIMFIDFKNVRVIRKNPMTLNSPSCQIGKNKGGASKDSCRLLPYKQEPTLQ